MSRRPTNKRKSRTNKRRIRNWQKTRYFEKRMMAFEDLKWNLPACSSEVMRRQQKTGLYQHLGLSFWCTRLLLLRNNIARLRTLRKCAPFRRKCWERRICGRVFSIDATASQIVRWASFCWYCRLPRRQTESDFFNYNIVLYLQTVEELRIRVNGMTNLPWERWIGRDTKRWAIYGSHDKTHSSARVLLLRTQIRRPTR